MFDWYVVAYLMSLLECGRLGRFSWDRHAAEHTEQICVPNAGALQNLASPHEQRCILDRTRENFWMDSKFI